MKSKAYRLEELESLISIRLGIQGYYMYVSVGQLVSLSFDQSINLQISWSCHIVIFIIMYIQV
jgi:hypothetical protein